MTSINQIPTLLQKGAESSSQINESQFNYQQTTTFYDPNKNRLIDLINRIFPRPPSAEEKLTHLLTNVVQQFIQLTERLVEILSSKIIDLTSQQNSASDTSSSGIASENAANTSSVDSGGQFLWKPKSEKDGRLAILLPPNMSEDIKFVTILDPKTRKTISKGKDSGIGNGNRAHFRFNKAGGSYPDNAIVEITYYSGDIKRIKIPETSKRYTR